MKQNNKILVDLNKVSYAQLLYVADSFGVRHTRHKEPHEYTVNGMEFDTLAIRSPLVSNETMIQYARRRNFLDYWYPELTLQLSNNHSLVYTGDKALDLWKVWQSKIFGKKKK